MDYFDDLVTIKTSKPDVSNLDDAKETKPTQLIWSCTVAWLTQYV